eukprot:6638998-Prymnesium_polylepis.1
MVKVARARWFAKTYKDTYVSATTACLLMLSYSCRTSLMCVAVPSYPTNRTKSPVHTQSILKYAADSRLRVTRPTQNPIAALATSGAASARLTNYVLKSFSESPRTSGSGSVFPWSPCP